MSAYGLGSFYGTVEDVDNSTTFRLSPSSDSLASSSSYSLIDSPNEERPYNLYPSTPPPPSPESLQPAVTGTSRIIRRFSAFALILLALVVGAVYSLKAYEHQKNLEQSLKWTGELERLEMERAKNVQELQECNWDLADREYELGARKEEVESAKNLGESLFWLGLGVNSWTTPMNHKRRSWGHTSFQRSLNRTIQVSSISFFPTSPARISTPPNSEIVGFSVQLSPESLTYGSWKATFYRSGDGLPGLRRTIGFEARSETWLEVTRWAVSARCFGLCAEVGDPSFWTNVYIARNAVGWIDGK
ncbi:hypothetical protein P7C70_g6114, partial [Phenoliferia sp. Uapishka_3]